MFTFQPTLSTGELLFPKMNAMNRSTSPSYCSSVSIVRQSSNTTGRLVIYDFYSDRNASTIYSIVDFKFLPVFDGPISPLVVSTGTYGKSGIRKLLVHGWDGFVMITNFTVSNINCSGKNS